MAQNFFSIIIPTYNRAELLRRSIKSALDQTFLDFEVLVCDDASTDNTESVIREFGDKRLKYLKASANGGNAVARNIGSKNASGQYVTFLDSDDAYHPTFLEKMHVLINENKNPGFLWCRVNRISEERTDEVSWPSSWSPESAKDPYAYFLKGLYFGTDFGFTVRRDCFATVGYFDESLRVAVDTDFILRIVQHFNFAYSKEILVDTYEHSGDRVRKNTLEKWRSYSLIIEKHRNKIKQNPRLLERWYYKLMWLAYHSRQKSAARRYWLFFIRRLSWKSIGLGMLFEILPVSNAIAIHKQISAGKKTGNVSSSME